MCIRADRAEEIMKYAASHTNSMRIITTAVEINGVAHNDY